jgi:hypothetical protein
MHGKRCGLKRKSCTRRAQSRPDRLDTLAEPRDIDAAECMMRGPILWTEKPDKIGGPKTHFSNSMGLAALGDQEGPP